MPAVDNRRIKRLTLLLALIAATGFAWTYWLRSFNASSDSVSADALAAVQDRDTQRIQGAIRSLQNDPERRSEVTFLNGAQALFLNRPDLALREFSAVQPKDKLRIPLLILTGEALYQTGEFVDAERCLLQAVAEDPENPDAHRWLATVYYDLGTMNRALLHLETISRLAPDDFRPHRMRGVIYREFDQNDEALAAFLKALELAVKPEDLADIRLSLALVEITRKEFERALQSLQESPDSAAVLAARAECWWNLGDAKRAEEQLIRSEELGEVTASGQRLQARMLIEDQKADVAITILSDLLTNDPSDNEAEYLLATAYRLAGDNALSTQHLQKSESLKALKTKLTSLSQQAMDDPDDAGVRDELASVCESLGMSEMAAVWRTAAAACRKLLLRQKESP